MKNRFLKTTIMTGALIPLFSITSLVISCAKTENIDDLTGSFLEKNVSVEKLFKYMEDNLLSKTIDGARFNLNNTFDKKIQWIFIAK